ncbi:MAG: hypothetical protein ACJAS4_002341 [Bacteriovoracaceae bacterium]|jgi:hypothetical protein
MKLRLAIMRIKTPILISKLHRRLFAISNGGWNDFLSFLIRFINPKIILSETSGVLEKENIKDVLSNLNERGYHVCESQLNESSINEILRFSKNTPLKFVKDYGERISYSKERISYKDCGNVESPRFQFDQSDIFKSPQLSDLVFDKSILNIAQEYLGSRPIFDLTAFWWSRKCNNVELEDFAAQKYHFDMDRIKFLKFFFYITDVTQDNGPHCFVEGSHKSLKPSFRGRGRFNDETVNSEYGIDKVKLFTGKSGSVLIVDTRGLHKGAPLVRGERLLFQIQFSNSMFGAPYSRVDLSKLSDNQIVNEITKYPLVYGPIFS